MNSVGNVSRRTEPFTLTAFVRVGYAPAYKRPDGVPEHAVIVKGYLVEPMRLPPELTVLSIAEMVMAPHKGHFTFDTNVINAPYGQLGIGAKLEKHLGTAIGGWFVITGKADA